MWSSTIRIQRLWPVQPTRLRAERSGVRVLTSTRNLFFFRNVQPGCGFHSTFYKMRTEFISREWIGLGVMLTSHRHLAQRVRMSGAGGICAPHPHVHIWHEQRQLYRYLFFYLVTFEEAYSPYSMICTKGCSYSFMYS